MAKNTTWLGLPCRRMKPTEAHRPAIWENMLGTVYARNAAGEVRYCDYRYEEAFAFAGVRAEGADLRVYRYPYREYAGPGVPASPRLGALVLYVRVAKNPVKATG